MKLAPHLPWKYGFDGKNPPEIPKPHDVDGHFYPSFDSSLWMFYRLWEPKESVAVRATLIIVHGTVDHSGVYTEFAKSLTDEGIAVLAMDMRGWGLSDGESMYYHDIDAFIGDIEAVFDLFHKKSRYSSVKARFLMGKSIGGLVSAHCVANHPSLFTGFIGLSGAFQVDPKMGVPSPFVVFLLGMVAMAAPKLPFKKILVEGKLVSDQEAYKAIQSDNLCSKDKLRLGYGLEMLRTIKLLEESAAARINVPTLMMIGDSDQVVTESGHQMVIDKMQHQDKVLKVYPGGLHNMLQEPHLKASVTSDIRAWILRHS